MGTIIPLFTAKEHPCSELAVLRKLARLNRATSEEMRTGLELLCVVDPVGFEVALPAARDRKSTRLNSSHSEISRMPSSA